MVAGDVTDLVRSLQLDDDSSCDEPPGLRASGLAGVSAKSLTRRGCRGTAEGDVGDVAPASLDPHRYAFESAKEEGWWWWWCWSGEAGWTKMKLLVLATGSDECDRW